MPTPESEIRKSNPKSDLPVIKNMPNGFFMYTMRKTNTERLMYTYSTCSNLKYEIENISGTPRVRDDVPAADQGRDDEERYF